MNRALAALVNGGLLSGLLTVVVWLVLRIVPRRMLNAATRYAVWWVTLTVVVLLPVAYWNAPKHAIGRRDAEKTAAAVSESSPVTQTVSQGFAGKAADGGGRPQTAGPGLRPDGPIGNRSADCQSAPQGGCLKSGEGAPTERQRQARLRGSQPLATFAIRAEWAF